MVGLVPFDDPYIHGNPEDEEIKRRLLWLIDHWWLILFVCWCWWWIDLGWLGDVAGWIFEHSIPLWIVALFLRRKKEIVAFLGAGAKLFSAFAQGFLKPRVASRYRVPEGVPNRGPSPVSRETSEAPPASTPLYTKVRSLLPNIPALKGISMPFGIPWRVVLAIGAVVMVLALLHFFGEARYAAGVSEEKARWERAAFAAKERTNQAEHRFRDDAVEIDDQARTRSEARNNALAETRQEIVNAADVEARLAALRDLRSGLWTQASERHARLKSDYLSSLDAG
jgi:hypothetical protein